MSTCSRVRRDTNVVITIQRRKSARYLGELAQWLKEETGYQWIQGTRPQTLSFGADRLARRPRCLDRGEIPCLVRLQRRRGKRLHPRPTAREHQPLLVHRRNRLVVLPVLLLHASAMADPRGRPDRGADRLRAFPREILRAPRSLAERTYTNLQRWTVMSRGGHFAAMEEPDALADDVRAFFRPLRG